MNSVFTLLIQVIESSWDSFVLAVSKPDCTLDTLIEEHAKYLNNITHKGLLGSGRSNKEGSLLGQLHELLKVIMSYKEGMV
jgi:gamma-tubulin complex component 3